MQRADCRWAARLLRWGTSFFGEGNAKSTSLSSCASDDRWSDICVPIHLGACASEGWRMVSAPTKTGCFGILLFRKTYVLVSPQKVGSAANVPLPENRVNGFPNANVNQSACFPPRVVILTQRSKEESPACAQDPSLKRRMTGGAFHFPFPKTVYKIIGNTGSSSRYPGMVRVGFAGRAASEKPIPLSLQAAGRGEHSPA